MAQGYIKTGAEFSKIGYIAMPFTGFGMSLNR